MGSSRERAQLLLWHHQEHARVVAGDVCPSWMHPPPPGAGRISCRELRQLLGILMKELLFDRDGEQEGELFLFLMVAITCLTPLPQQARRRGELIPGWR